MAAHVRTQIREAIAAAITGLTTTGARVYLSRVYPLQNAELPGLLVRNADENSTPITIDEPALLDRVARFEVVGVAKLNEDLDAELDQICKEVEIALVIPSSIAALARTIRLLTTSFDLQGTSERPAGTATMLYEVNYFTRENAPDVAH